MDEIEGESVDWGAIEIRAHNAQKKISMKLWGSIITLVEAGCELYEINKGAGAELLLDRVLFTVEHDAQRAEELEKAKEIGQGHRKERALGIAGGVDGKSVARDKLRLKCVMPSNSKGIQRAVAESIAAGRRAALAGGIGVDAHQGVIDVTPLVSGK